MHKSSVDDIKPCIEQQTLPQRGDLVETGAAAVPSRAASQNMARCRSLGKASVGLLASSGRCGTMEREPAALALAPPEQTLEKARP